MNRTLRRQCAHLEAPFLPACRSTRRGNLPAGSSFIPLQLGDCALKFVSGGHAMVPLLTILHEGHALPFRRKGQDATRLSVREGSSLEAVDQRLHVMAIHFMHIPAKGAPARSEGLHANRVFCKITLLQEITID